MLHGYLDNDI
jgi:hypothetical protein